MFPRYNFSFIKSSSRNSININIYTIYNPLILTKKNNDYDLNSKIILSAGRLTYQKGFDMLVEVAKKVLIHNNEWKWIILGN